MLDRLVAMCIVTHVHNGHFTDFVNHLSVVAVVKNWWYGKYGVHHCDKHVFPTHQVDKSLRVVEYRPGVVPTVSFRESVPPFQRREWRLECTVLVAAAHQFGFFVEKILVVHGTFGKEVDFLFRMFQFFGEFVDAPVVVCIFQCTGGVLVDFYIIGNIAQFVVIFMSQASCWRDFGVYILRAVNQSFIQSLYIVHFHAFHISVYQDRSGVIADHATSVSRTCPFGEESAFFICIDKSFLHFLVDRRVHQVQQREQATESIPETCIGVHISRQNLTVVRAVMNRLPGSVQFVELAREKQWTVQARIECTVLVEIASFHFYLS